MEQAWKRKAGGIVATVVQVGAFTSLFLEVGSDDTGLRRFIVFVSSLFGLPVDENLFIFVVLLVLGAALRRRKRAALWALILFEIGNILTAALWQAAILSGLDVLGEPANTDDIMIWLGATEVTSGAILVLLLALRPAFPAQQASGAMRRAVTLLLGGLTAVTVLGYALTTVFPGTLTDIGERLIWSANQATGEVLRLRSLGVGHGPGWLSTWLDILGALVAVIALVVFFRGVRSRRLLTSEEELKLRELLAEHGERDSLATSRPDGTKASCSPRTAGRR